MDLIIDILKLLVPTLIALVSLVYAVKQRNVVKKEISKKRYLESAQTNLNEAIKSLKEIVVPSDLDSIENPEIWEDTSLAATSLTADILRASFHMKRKKLDLEISYETRSYRKTDKTKLQAADSNKEERVILSNYDELGIQAFTDLLRTNEVTMIDGKTTIANHKRFWGDDLNFTIFLWALKTINEAREKLSNYEEVYESVCPDTLKEIDQLFENVAKDIFETIRKPKVIQINLGDFSGTLEIAQHLLREILNYPLIAERFTKVTEIISGLTEARKQLFLKIS